MSRNESSSPPVDGAGQRYRTKNLHHESTLGEKFVTFGNIISCKILFDESDASEWDGMVTYEIMVVAKISIHDCYMLNDEICTKALPAESPRAYNGNTPLRALYLESHDTDAEVMLCLKHMEDYEVVLSIVMPVERQKGTCCV